MELKAGRLSDTINLTHHHHLTMTLAYGSIKLFMKGEAGIKICFFSSISKHFSLDIAGYDSLVLEAFDDCSYTYEIS